MKQTGLVKEATGGTITYDGEYTIHTFLSSGTFTPLGVGEVEYLVVAGGGAGGVGGGGAGAGGAGGFRTDTGHAVTAQGYSITVGGGGAAITGTGYNDTQNDGSNSVFDTITSTGGGGGSGSNTLTGGDGGSGGGGAGGQSLAGGSASPSGQGYAGGDGYRDGSSNDGGGGGGGASEVGETAYDNGPSVIAGDGGDGLTSSISGSSVTYAGGGGGAHYFNTSEATAGAGGAGGGGGGGVGSSAGAAENGTNGTANTGGGGGAAGNHNTSATSGAGGSGIVIIRYKRIGADLRITTDSAGTTEIPFEIVSMDTSAETSEIWAKVPSMLYASDTSLFIWYGNASAVAYASDDTYGSENVWSDYSAVYHMEGNSSDSTDGGHTGTDTSITYSTDNGEIGQGAGFNSATPSQMTVADANELDLTGDHTVQNWFNTNNNNTTESMVEKYTGGNGWLYRLDNSGKLVFWNQQGSGAQLGTVTGDTAVGTDAWKMGHGTYDGTNLRVYLNGAIDGTSASYTYGNSASTNILRIGTRADNGTSNPYSGELDEVRIRESALSADWITTEYNNQNSPSTFWTAVSGRRIFIIG